MLLLNPTLQPLSGETCQYKTANHNDNARPYIGVILLWLVMGWLWCAIMVPGPVQLLKHQLILCRSLRLVFTRFTCGVCLFICLILTCSPFFILQPMYQTIVPDAIYTALKNKLYNISCTCMIATLPWFGAQEGLYIPIIHWTWISLHAFIASYISFHFCTPLPVKYLC